MATEISRDTAATVSQALAGLMRCLSGIKVGDTSKFVVVEAYNGGLGIYPVSRSAGERQEDSTTGTDHVSVAPEGMVKKVVYSDGDTILWNGPSLLFGFRITNALSAHAWTIDDNATARIDIAASAAAGIYALPCAVIFETSLVANVGASASAGVIEFYFRPLDPAVTWAY